MTWQDLKIFLISFLLPFSVAIIPLLIMLIKERTKNKRLTESLSIDKFDALINAGEKLRNEFREERDYLKGELEQERGMVKQMANQVVAITSKNEQVLQQNKLLVRHLQNMLGMKNLINIKNIKIAVLEDNEDDIILLQKMLKANGIDNVFFYSDPESFIEGIDSNVRILIIDHKLEGTKNGLDVIREIIDAAEYRYFMMLSGMEDFNVIYSFNQLVTHGVYILKGRPESDDLIVKSIRNQVYYMNIIAEAYNDTSKTE